MDLHLAMAGVLTALALAAAPDAAAAAPSPYDVVWETPSEDHQGSMPLGNGEVALNAWVEPSGDLRFYIARTDAWDEHGRLVKVGGMRVRVGDGSPERTRRFRQALTLKDGTLRARYGEGDDRVDLRLWVDANRPVVCVEVDTAKPAEATATAELWRTQRQTLPSVETSDIYAGGHGETVVEPDTVLADLKDAIGWYHRNTRSVGPELCAKIQAVADFPRPDPLLHRTFGALVATERPERVDDRTLRSRAGRRHLFEVYVHAKHPATEAEWLAEARQGLDAARAVPLARRRQAHEAWWAGFWSRSWIHITANGEAPDGAPVEDVGVLPANRHPLRIGMDQAGSNRFAGAFGRVAVYETALADADIARMAARGPEEKAEAHPALLYGDRPEGPLDLPQFAERAFEKGVTVEAWIRPETVGRAMRIADKITPGGADGFLFDTHPGTSLRLISGRGTLQKANLLAAGKWQHVAAVVHPNGQRRIFLNGARMAAGDSSTTTGLVADGDAAFVVTRAYALQRYIAACAGRGAYPIKFNGSLFTVPAEGAPGGPDYRRWGPGYWWQNTRLPYYSMCASGDFEMVQPLFRMYARDLMPLFRFRTQRHLGHDGAYIPECIYFWGDVFTETYGWQPFEEREDKLQASRWHKWEWVSGLELAGLTLDYYEHTQDAAFLRESVLPTAREILTFFDRHYPTGPDGKLRMHPSQSLETWWDCVNPMPEVAGLHAITARLLALPEALTPPEERAFWEGLRAKLPAIPTTRTEEGKVMLAPAQEFREKRNVENPELYAVFPFRVVGVGRPNLEQGIEALNRRGDRGAQGWRQDDIFMAWLGLAEPAREYVVKRARARNAASRFPAFWGPNYDWVPDQDHGSVLLKAVQSLLLQTDGRAIHLLPAWPKGWDCEFRLHAPYRTTVSGKVEKGRLVRLDVRPASRRKDVTVWAGGGRVE